MNILIVRNQERPEALEAAFSLSAYLTAEGHSFEMIDAAALMGIALRTDLASHMDMAFDLAVVLGGDGTIIRAASLIRSASPVLGINFGHLGFLANDSGQGVISLVARALCGELSASRRACLEAVFFGEGEEELGSSFAVNEIAITRGMSPTSLEFGFDVSGVHMADLKGDGLIVATATGSTAYSLAAGGPLVTPGFDGMVVQPLAPHTLMSRAILTDANDVVEAVLRRQVDREAAQFMIDGDARELDGPVASVQVQRARDHVTFLYDRQDHFLSYSAHTFFAERRSLS